MSLGRNKGTPWPPESRRKRAARKVGLLFFLLYMAVLVYFLFFADWYEHGPGMHFEAGRNFIPFLEIRRSLRILQEGKSLRPFLNLAGNILGFVPFGFFLPVVTRRLRSFPLVVLLGFLFSCGVEVLQLITKSGNFDVDDMILNTTGTAAGYLLFLITDHLRRRVMALRRKG